MNFDPMNHATSLLAPIGVGLLLSTGINLWNSWYPSKMDTICKKPKVGPLEINPTVNLIDVGTKVYAVAGATLGSLWNYLSWGALAATCVAGGVGAYYLAKRISKANGANANNNNNITIHIHLADPKLTEMRQDGQTVKIEKTYS